MSPTNTNTPSPTSAFSTTQYNYDTINLQSPSPSHQRERSLDDLVYSDNSNNNNHNRNNSTTRRKHNYQIPRYNYNNLHHTMNAATIESFNKLRHHNEQLQSALDFEENESMRLEKLVKEFRQRYDSSLAEQSKLEQDILNKDAEKENLQKQLKEMKRQKHELENTLTQEQMTYINEKQQWLDKEAEYEARLKKVMELDSASLNDSVIKEEKKEETLVKKDSKKDTKAEKERQKVVEKMKNELDVTRQQLELVSKEYSLRHEQVKQELDQTKELNHKLQEENENFQVLLAQKAVMGEFSLENELQNINENENDDFNGNSNAEEDEEEIRTMKQRIYNLEFETKSLNNHNRALKSSLERLVQRLLEYKDFEQVVEDSQAQITPRSISLFQRRVGPNSSNNQNGEQKRISSNTHHTLAPLEVPKQRVKKGSMSSGFQFPLTNGAGHDNNSSTTIRGLNRAIKPPSTWSSIIFSGVDTNSSNESSTTTTTHQHHSNSGLESPVSCSSSGTNTAEVVSSASSIDSTIAPTDLQSVLSDTSSTTTTRRPKFTQGQKKLRPLKLQPCNEVSVGVDSKDQLQPPTSASSGWSFGLT